MSKDVLQEQIFNILSKYKVELMDECDGLDFEQYIKLFLSSQKLEGLSVITLYNYELLLNHCKKYLYKPISDINTNDIRLYLGQFDHLKSSTISTKIYILKSFFGWLHAEEIINKNPMLRIKNPKPPHRLPKGLSIPEIEMMREGCVTLRERALFEVAYSTGARLSELVAMKKNGINWNQQSMRTIGKGSKERTIYLSFTAVYHLKKYLHSRKDNNIALFVGSRQPHGGLGERAMQRDIKKIAGRTDIDKNVHIHALRHSMATHMLNNGMDMTTIAAILGHSNLATTQIYASVSDEYVRSEYRKYFAQ